MEKEEIFDTSIAIEKNEGLITIFTAIEYPNSSKKYFDILLPEITDYLKAIEIANKLREKGRPIGAIDILIAAMVLNRAAKLISKDKDFKIIKEIYPDFQLKIT